MTSGREESEEDEDDEGEEDEDEEGEDDEDEEDEGKEEGEEEDNDGLEILAGNNKGFFKLFFITLTLRRSTSGGINARFCCRH